MNRMYSNKPCELTVAKFFEDMAAIEDVMKHFEQIEDKLYTGSPTP